MLTREARNVLPRGQEFQPRGQDCSRECQQVRTKRAGLGRVPRLSTRGSAFPRPVKERTTPRQYLREVRGELRKVAWPTRGEVVNYSIIVLVAIVLLTAYVAFLDYGFGDVLLKLFSR